MAAKTNHKTFQQQLNDIFNALGVASTAGNPLGPQQGQSGGLGPQQQQQGLTTTITTTGTSGPLLTPAQLQQLLGTMHVGLSSAEQQELADLKLEHESKIKQEKLSIFKKIPSNLRQFVINFFLWQEVVSAMDQFTIDRSQRQIDLEQKDQNGKLFTQNWGHFQSVGLSDMVIPTQLSLPQGISIEDLKQAHLEASLEEEMLDGEEKS